ncbi:MAG TPA: hypothetical protein VGL10_09300 [Gammaproteobacteria bacterium]
MQTAIICKTWMVVVLSVTAATACEPAATEISPIQDIKSSPYYPGVTPIDFPPMRHTKEVT